MNLVWKVEIDSAAQKQLRKLGQDPARRVVAGLKKIAALPDPRVRAKAMVGEWAGYWRFRFDDFRVIARLEDDKLVILVVAVGHRSQVYR